jgi:hypothetical protein
MTGKSQEYEFKFFTFFCEGCLELKFDSGLSEKGNCKKCGCSGEKLLPLYSLSISPVVTLWKKRLWEKKQEDRRKKERLEHLAKKQKEINKSWQEESVPVESYKDTVKEE